MDIRSSTRPRKGEAPTHKYAVGAKVLHKVGHLGDRRPFEITRLMPDGGAGFQYRLRCDDDGHERVAVETALERRDPEEFT